MIRHPWETGWDWIAARDYRDDDQSNAFCPECGKPLTALTVEEKGYCEDHGWQWADWTPLTAGETLHPLVRKRWERTP